MLAKSGVVLLSLLASVANAARSADTPIGFYIPKLWPSYIGIALYGTVAVIFWFYLWRFGKKYQLTLCIAMSTMTIGFGLRVVFHTNYLSMGVYIIMTLCLLLSPCGFLAADYIILGRLADAVSPNHLLIRRSRLVKFFVGSDITTFLLQGAGGGLSATKGNQSIANVGTKISLVALILQALSFATFMVVLFTWGFRVKKQLPDVWASAGRDGKNWRVLYFALCLTSIGVITRSVYRVAEFADGYDSYLAIREGYFYLLDALALFLAMSLYIFVWPPRYIPDVPYPGALEDVSIRRNDMELGGSKVESEASYNRAY